MYKVSSSLDVATAGSDDQPEPGLDSGTGVADYLHVQLVPGLPNRSLQPVDRRVALGVDSGLEYAPDAEIHHIQVGAVRGPLALGDKVHPPVPKPVLGRLCFVCRGSVLLEHKVLIIGEDVLAKVADSWPENVLLVVILVHFDPLRNEEKGRLSEGADSAEDHHTLGMLLLGDETVSGWGLGDAWCQNTLVLRVEGLVAAEDLLIGPDTAVVSTSAKAGSELLDTIQSLLDPSWGNVVNLLEPKGLEAEVLLDESAHGVAGDAESSGESLDGLLGVFGDDGGDLANEGGSPNSGCRVVGPSL